MFARFPDGPALLQTLLANVKVALVHGIQLIFLSAAIIMTASVALNLALKNVPLHSGKHEPKPSAPPH